METIKFLLGLIVLILLISTGLWWSVLVIVLVVFVLWGLWQIITGIGDMINPKF